MKRNQKTLIFLSIAVGIFLIMYALAPFVFSVIIDFCFGKSLANPVTTLFWEYIPKWRLPFATALIPIVYLIFTTKFKISTKVKIAFFGFPLIGFFSKLIDIYLNDNSFENQLIDGDLNFAIWMFCGVLLFFLVWQITEKKRNSISTSF